MPPINNPALFGLKILVEFELAEAVDNDIIFPALLLFGVPIIIGLPMGNL